MKLYVIKIGGNVIDDERQLSLFLDDLASVQGNKILVHGGGKIATDMSKQLGIEAKMVDGRRITDAETLKVVQMVYAGLINKNIVAQLQSRNCHSIGLTGADANLILAKKRPVKEVDYGFVGDIERVNAEGLTAFLRSDFSLVIAPLTHDGKGQILNTNADTMASAIAVAMAKTAEVNLVYCFEKSGVLKNVDDESSVIGQMDAKEYAQLKSQGIISKGMIPKLDNAFEAIQKGVRSVTICHARDLKKITINQNAGTRLI